jgi:hypothetical protein
MLLKACEIIPKIIRNPLLFGRVTTYVFFVLFIFEGVFMLERVVLRRNPNFYMSEFWTTFALLIWQKVLFQFIYDYRIKACIFLFLYVYYSFRVADSSLQVLPVTPSFMDNTSIEPP